MSFSTKNLFTWLLLLAVPLQGYAASTMLICGQGHHASASRTTARVAEQNATSAANHDHSAAHQDHASHAHQHIKSQFDLENAASPQDHALTKVKGKHLSGKCSVCASCCGSAAMISTFVLPPLERASSMVEPLPLPHIVDITIHGFERPPRA